MTDNDLDKNLKESFERQLRQTPEQRKAARQKHHNWLKEKAAQNDTRDKAQDLAEAIRLQLTTDNDFQIKLNGSTVWLEDIHGSGFVAWAEDNTGWDALTQTVLPELRQPVSGAENLPTITELNAFIDACQGLAVVINGEKL